VHIGDPVPTDAGTANTIHLTLEQHNYIVVLCSQPSMNTGIYLQGFTKQRGAKSRHVWGALPIDVVYWKGFSERHKS
jgi:hypothetical protein